MLKTVTGAGWFVMVVVVVVVVIIDTPTFWPGMWNVGAGMGAGSVLLGTPIKRGWESLSSGGGCIVSRLDSDSEELELNVVRVKSSGVALGATTGDAFLVATATTAELPMLLFFSPTFLADSFSLVLCRVLPEGAFVVSFRHDNVLGRMGRGLHDFVVESGVSFSSGAGILVVGFNGCGF